MTQHVLTLRCPDRPGIVHAMTAGVLDVDGNLESNEQFSDPETSTFCMLSLIHISGALGGLVDRCA